MQYPIAVCGAAIDVGNPRIMDNIPKREIQMIEKKENDERDLHRIILLDESEEKKAEMLKILLDEGADVRRRNESGQTPLHLASQKGFGKLVEILLAPDFSEENGAFVEKMAAQLGATNSIGETALHMASAKNHRKVVEILLKNGIDVNGKTIFGKTALDVAFEHGCRQAFVVLLKYGAEIDVAYAARFLGGSRTNFCVIKCDRGEFITSNRFCVEKIRKHILRMKTAGKIVSKGNLRCLDEANDTLKSYQDKCEEEIARMREEKIERNFSFYDVLRKSGQQLAIHARNQCFIHAVEDQELKNKFPIYAEMISYNFRRGQVRDVLVGFGINSFNSTSELFLPPEIVVDDIFTYLKNEDLGNLIEAF